MKPPSSPDGGTCPPPDDATTGLPLLRTWPAVYVAVVGVFVGWVALLVWLSVAFA